MEQDSRLIAVSLSKINSERWPGPNGQLCQRVEFRGHSSSNGLSFKYETNPLVPAQLEQCRALKRHGFTAVEAPEDWQYGYYNVPGGWQVRVIQMAMDKIAALAEGEEKVAAFDEKLAHEVLKLVNDHFPKQITMVQLKHELNPEPGDETLLLALDALLIQKLIEGPHIRSGIQNELHDMALVRITAAGRNHLQRDSQSNAAQVIYRDQYINLGHAGAVGPNSKGNINVGNTIRQQIESESDLNTIANELGQLRMTLQQSCITREDAKQIGIIAEAEEAAESGDGGKMMSILSKVAKSVCEVAERIGTDIAAKVIVEAGKG